MSTTITATALVTFDSGGASSEHLSAQIDDMPGGYNGGKTSFRRGDQPAFLVWCSMADTLNVEAAGGTTSLVARNIITSHNQDVAEYIPTGETEVEVQMSPPARALPTLQLETAATGITLVAGKTLADGSLGSVVLTRTDTSSGRWIVGNLAWTALATAYRITPAESAKRVMLLASAKGEA